MNSQEKKNEFRALQRRIRAYQHALTLMEYDALTGGMPKGGAEGRGKASSVLSGELFLLETGKETRRLLDELREESLSWQEKCEWEEMNRNLERRARVPESLIIELEKAKNDGNHYWREARAAKDFDIFRPHLEKLLSLSLVYAKMVDDDMDPYDVFLDHFERGLSMEKLEPFFEELKKTILPLLSGIREQDAVIPEEFLHRFYPLEGQRKLSDRMMKLMGIDQDRCTLGETEHPFTLDFGRTDVRITTKYIETDMLNNLFSIIHESGHALYELHVGEELDDSILGHGSTTAIHESQSRMWENLIARSRSFASILYEEVKRIFPEQLSDVTEEAFYRAINIVRPSLIRTEADELTYCIHVMIRYEIEKKLFHGELTMEDLPAEWNRLYEEYLGIRVPDDTVGVLQDAHWAGGAFGYFPSYALGNAYSAQIFRTIEREIDFERCCRDSDFSPVLDFLTERMYRYGMMLGSEEILDRITGEAFDPSCYTEYLERKYRGIYGI